MKRTAGSARDQHGVVLIATMILLVLLTILALAAVSMNSTQTRVATNSADQQVAYQNAEGVLNQAVNMVTAGAYSTTMFSSGTPGLFILNPNALPPWQPQANRQPSAIWASGSGQTIPVTFPGDPAPDGQFVVELLPPVVKPGQAMNAQTQVYRITAYAVGKSGGSPVVLQSTLQIQ